MEMTARDQRAIILGGAALGLLALYAGVIEPSAKAHDVMMRSHAAAAQQLAGKRREQQKQAYEVEQIKQWEAKAGTLAAPKPHSETITRVGSEIIGAAQSSGVELQSATPGQPTLWPEDASLEQCLVSIEAKADWENAFKFVAALYRIDGVLSVEQMELSSGDKKGGGKLTLRLSVSLLFQARPAGGAR